jgi:hypothetical protein
MSHIRKLAIAIKKLNKSIAKKALELLARKYKLKLTNEIKDYYGRSHYVDLGLSGSGNRGYGIIEREGNFEIVGDDYAQSLTLDQFRLEFERAYIMTAYREALAIMGYSAQVQERDNAIVIRGIKP